MRYSVASNFKNVSVNWKKCVLHWENCNFEPIMNSAHMAEVLVLEKALDKNVDYLIITQAENEMKAFQKQVYILQSWKTRS